MRSRCWRMDCHELDALVIGAGIAGATAAAHLAADRRVALIEAEEAPGYHTTGRSAALWVLNYGPADVRALTGLSRPFFESPPPGFANAPLLRRRPVVFLARPEERQQLEQFVAEGTGLRQIPVPEVASLVPALREGYAESAAIEEDAFDIDVAALLHGFLRQFRAEGGLLALRHRAGRIERRGGKWHVETSGGVSFAAPVLVNACGAWGDEIAAQAGVAPLGVVPKRRTACIIDPVPFAVADWPVLIGVTHTWLARPEARSKLMVSPLDETPMQPHDVQADELDVAVAIDRVQQALSIPVARVEHRWAGLRTFTPDGSLALGWAEGAPGFFWSVGQGGYGIQTAPAAGKLVADIIAGRDPGPAGSVLRQIDPGRFARASLCA